MTKIDRNRKELKKLELKLKLRRLLPSWLLKLIRRRQVPLKKMLYFKAKYEMQKIVNPTKAESLAIIIPCYNHAEFLPLAFESAFKQTEKPEQIIIIDDFSTDNTQDATEEMVANYQRANPDSRIKIILDHNEQNLGQAMTINKAVALATTDLIMILNDDDYLMCDAVEIAKKTFHEHPELALLGATNITITGNGEISGNSKLAQKQLGVSDELTIR